jgi:histidinol-phosphate aminotransferase
VIVGRTWQSWPTKSRITIGSADDMAKFKAAFEKVWA